ncbi:hypothetical protein [Catenulispora rubra]|uniref:hypothetical protein n=1 Tax=Catenulispora rubra TaxID=280293 RepID=UPI0018928134|nr:hypothetical protein [Catenulispora rubra]
MSTPNEYDSLHGLEIEIEAELTVAESTYPPDVTDAPVTEWLSDPADDERYEVGLHGLLDAVKAMEDATSHNPASQTEGLSGLS